MQPKDDAQVVEEKKQRSRHRAKEEAKPTGAEAAAAKADADRTAAAQRGGSWEFSETRFGGAYSMANQPIEETGRGMAAGIAKLKARPEKYESVMVQSNIGDDVEYTLFRP